MFSSQYNFANSSIARGEPVCDLVRTSRYCRSNLLCSTTIGKPDCILDRSWTRVIQPRDADWDLCNCHFCNFGKDSLQLLICFCFETSSTYAFRRQLIVNGPDTQEYTATFEDLISEIYAAVWAIVLLICMSLSAVALIPIFDLHKSKEWFRYLILLTARASAFSLNLTTGKALVLQNDRTWFIVNICVKVISGAIYTRAIVVQATAVQQKIFVPVNAALIMLVNAITGIIIWEDWRVVQSWVGYVAVFLLLALGCGLLLSDLAFIQESKPDTFLGARPTIILKQERTKLLENLRQFQRMSNIDYDLSDSHNDDPSSSHGDPASSPGIPTHPAGRKSRPSSMARFSTRLQRNEKHRVAWASIYDATGATHSLVARTSTMLSIDPQERNSLMPIISSHDLVEDEDDESKSGKAEEENGAEDTDSKKKENDDGERGIFAA